MRQMWRYRKNIILSFLPQKRSTVPGHVFFRSHLLLSVISHDRHKHSTQGGREAENHADKIMHRRSCSRSPGQVLSWVQAVSPLSQELAVLGQWLCCLHNLSMELMNLISTELQRVNEICARDATIMHEYFTSWEKQVNRHKNRQIRTLSIVHGWFTIQLNYPTVIAHRPATPCSGSEVRSPSQPKTTCPHPL